MTMHIKKLSTSEDVRKLDIIIQCMPAHVSIENYEIRSISELCEWSRIKSDFLNIDSTSNAFNTCIFDQSNFFQSNKAFTNQLIVLCAK